MIRCIIIDDEPLAQELLEEHMERIPYLQLAAKFNSAPAAQQFLKTAEVDLILLDIEMPEMTGIRFLQTLSQPPLTIFTTAYRNYAFEGFELGVIDFLLKPISFSRFSSAVEKVRDFLTLQVQGTHLEPGEPAPEFIFVKSGTKRIKLFFDKISHIQGLKDYAIIYTSEQKVVIKGSVKMVQEMLPSTLFLRVHKSFLVAKLAVRHIERNRIIIDHYQVPIGRNYREDVEKNIRMC